MQRHSAKELDKLKKPQLCQMVIDLEEQLNDQKIENELLLFQNTFQKDSIADLANNVDLLKHQLTETKEEIDLLKNQKNSTQGNLLFRCSNCGKEGMRKPLINLQQAVAVVEPQQQESESYHEQPKSFLDSNETLDHSNGQMNLHKQDLSFHFNQNKKEINNLTNKSDEVSTTISSQQINSTNSIISDFECKSIKSMNLIGHTCLIAKAKSHPINFTREITPLIKSFYGGSIVLNQNNYSHQQDQQGDKNKLNSAFNSFNVDENHGEAIKPQLIQSSSQENLKSDLPSPVKQILTQPEPIIFRNSLASQARERTSSQQNQIQQENINESHPVGSQLFQGLFIMGPSISAIREAIQNQTFEKSCVVPPEMYITFPFQYNKGEEYQRQSLKKHCFPYDVSFHKQKVSLQKSCQVDNILNIMIFKNHTANKISNSFLIKMLGDKQSPIAENHTMLKQINPQLSLYCISYTFENFYTVPSSQGLSKSLEKCIYLAPMTLCFMTYYPFIDYFLDIILAVVENFQRIKKENYLKIFSASQVAINSCQYCNTKQNPLQIQGKSNDDSDILEKSSYNKNEKNIGCSECVGKNLAKLLELDAQQDLNNFFSDQMSSLLSSLQKFQLVNPSTLQQLNFQYTKNSIEENLNYEIPSENQLCFLEAQWGACQTFASLSLEDFLFVLTAVCLEQKVVFFSENFSLLTSSILTFPSLMKPIFYPFYSIFSLNEELQGMLDTLVPILIGINKNISYLADLEEEGYLFNDKIVVDLDEGSIYCQDLEIYSYLTENMIIFKNNQTLLTANYFKINPSPSLKLSNFNKIRQKKDKINLNPSGAPSSALKSKKRQFEVSEEQIKATNQILQCIHSTFNSLFFSTLPKKDKVMKEGLDLNLIRTKVLKDISSEKQFASEFVKTQSFTSFIEEHYYQIS